MAHHGRSLTAATMMMLGVLVALAQPASAAPVVAGATLTLNPTSGTADKTVTATFQVQLAGDDALNCDLTTLFRWDGTLLGTQFTESCTSRVSFVPPAGQRGPGKHQVTAEDVHTHAKAAAVFTVPTPAATARPTTTGTAAGRTMAHGGPPGAAGGNRDGGERVNRPSAVPEPSTQPVGYPATAPIATRHFPLSSWLIGSGTAVVVVGALIILLAFPQKPSGDLNPDPLAPAMPGPGPRRGAHIMTGRITAQIRDRARSLMKQCSPNWRARRRANSASPGVSA